MSAGIAGLAAIGGFLLFAIYEVFKSMKKKTTALQFAGQVAVSIDEISPGKAGFVRFHGEHWKATSESTIVPGQKVKILSREGLTLIVEPVKDFS